MRRTAMTSLLTLGGLALAVMQMMRMRVRPRGWRMITRWLSQGMNQMTNRSNMITRMVRRRARI